MDCLTYAGFNSALIEETKNWRADKGKKFNLKKDDVICIPAFSETISIGLGWDTRVDIDASVLLLGAGGMQKDIVYYGKKVSNDSAIRHSGDNLTGEGKGDDETIICNLGHIDPSVQSIWPVINIYTSGNQFDDVSGAYCRIIDTKTGVEFCRYNLSDNKDGVSTGCIVADIRRSGPSWVMKARGYYTEKT